MIWSSAAQALSALGPDDFVVLGMSEPVAITTALATEAERLRGLNLVSWPLVGPGEYLGISEFHHTILRCRGASRVGHVRYLPTRTGDAHLLFTGGVIPSTWVVAHVAPPDADGWMSMGLMADYTYDLATSGRVSVIAEVNAALPRTPGPARIHVDQCQYLVRSDITPAEIPTSGADPESRTIAKACAALIPDRAVIQIGIGTLPNAICQGLTSHSDLGLHSGMLSDSLMDLIVTGVMNGASKSIGTGRAVTGSILGTRRLYEWCDRNESVELTPFSMTHDPRTLGAIDGLVAINSALQVDLTGQVNSESVGGRALGNVGGQPDFQHGAVRASGGRGIVALRSTWGRDGLSTIVEAMAEGDPVSVPRADADTFVTEQGTAEVRGQPIGPRAHRLVTVAHPRHRSRLERAATRLGD